MEQSSSIYFPWESTVSIRRDSEIIATGRGILPVSFRTMAPRSTKMPKSSDKASTCSDGRARLVLACRKRPSLMFMVFASMMLAVPNVSALVESNDHKFTAKVQNFVGSALSNSRRILKHRTVVAKATGSSEDVAKDQGLYASFFVPLLAGGFATAFGDIIVHPLDTIKTVQQACVFRPRPPFSKPSSLRTRR